jgi:hypothetical protein
LADFVQVVDTEVSSWRSTVEFGQYAFHFTIREEQLRYFKSSVGEPLVALQYSIPY